MIIGVVFENGVEIKRGIKLSGKQWCQSNPKQYIGICSNTRFKDGENIYVHDGIITFKELQDNGHGWEAVYDSNEKLDKTVYYPLPNYFFNGEKIPHIESRINEIGTVDSEFIGYY